MGNGGVIRATADGEMRLCRYERDVSQYELTEGRQALLEAQKSFVIIEDSKPAMTDDVLGQLTCEVLASST